MNPDWWLCVLRVVLDWLLVMLLHVAFHLLKGVKVPLSGFFCEDHSIRYPYYDSTIPTKALLGYGYGLPIALVVILEPLAAIYRYYVVRAKNAWKTMAVRMYNLITIYMLAIGITRAATWLFKITTKANRPHFLDVCQPNITLASCTGFVNEYSCQGIRTNLMAEINVSFVSGHSTVTAVAVMFIVLYLQERLQLSCAPLLRPMLQTAIVSFGLYVAISRYTDKKHHVSDIIAGALVGAGSAMALFLGYLPTMKELPPWRWSE
ncbi:Phospholipid phosphatase 1 [Clonorchis sinensis]|uniref:Phospholipid phosphatase 1 n=1 Tax=Clonorchis sinensis TaxID=79923 RepID=A0A419PY15_CLOSI|nr:Phospholipid phosphatase 1 [Clonorchis sinensis]